MSAQSFASVLDAVASRVSDLNGSVHGAALRKQAAFVHTLIDEIERCGPTDRWGAALAEQLGEEMARLGRLLVDSIEPQEARAS